MSNGKIDFERLSRAHWTPEQRENAELVVDFVQKIMNDHDFNAVRQLQGQAPYKQHSQGISDGISGVTSYLEKFVKSFPEFSYDIKSVIVDGDMVSIHSHGTLKKKHRGNDKKGLNIIDTWRIENGRLVEHWDAIQGIDFGMRLYAVLIGGKRLNSNGLF